MPLWAAMLCTVLWMVVGLFGHEPYKPDEAYTVGLIKSVVDTGDWVVPRLTGEPFMEKPPLFFDVAALCAMATPWLPLHEAARLAVLLFVGLGLLATAAAGRDANGAGGGRLAALLALATVGAVEPLHQVITDTALLAGIAIAMLGLVRVPQRPAPGGLLLGAGLGISFLAKGLIGPGLIVCTMLVLLVFPPWRRGPAWRGMALAALVASVAAACWVVPLALRSPELLHVWFFDNNLGRFLGLNELGPKKDIGFYWRALPWYALLCWPLILRSATLWRADGATATENVGDLPSLVFIAVALAVLSVASDGRVLYALVLLPALAIAATRGLLTVSVSAERRWAVGIAAVLLLASVVVLIAWALAMITPGFTSRLPVAAALPNMVAPPPGALVAYGFAVLAVMLLWTTLRQPLRGTLPLAGASGAALLWATLTMPWGAYLDELKGYRSLALELASQLPEANCIASRGLGEGERALLDYYIGLRTERFETAQGAARCDALLVQILSHTDPGLKAPWQIRWEGARGSIAYDTSRMRLFVRPSAAR